MPKSELVTTEDIERFISVWGAYVRKAKYVACYARQDRLLVFIPATSTDPIIYGYKLGIEEKAAMEILARFSIRFWSCATWDFEAERGRQVSV